MKFRSLLLAALVAFTGSAMALEAGQAAPALDVAGAKDPVSLSALKGKVVYVDFWASWCAPCKQSFPWMNEMQAKYGNRGLQIVAVNVDAKREDADRFLAEVPANFVIGYDAKGDSPKRFQIKGMPSSVLVGPDGQVIKVHAGFRPDERKAQEDAIVAALAQIK
ncbi:TlpA family protein disulfide reductase [Piscinibacter gummiphilus]|uniref:Thiol:disulfide interchange protein n=1 Tax=Piscinibacter gummiphilus TaxID=946333 RepID=A0A1W6LB60_9BURK|nr:TlpA disulfide reductase family protein [Piscinibacter gummiphilus]ARN21509.1 thiol:disulfide interchange protein [Piscinibacter gummiphilus]ATU66194.1 TlpA family protein disulfide reductase [Piscinibacter gummiphilus]GLS96126.1 thiol:disulfide interchange protein [Piscinibacter gummiphilus]